MNIRAGNVILSNLTAIHTRSYFDRAPIGTTFPYITFKTPSTFYAENNNYIMLEVNVWENKGNNIATLEQITENVRKGLQKNVYVDSYISMKYEFESLLHLDDDEEQIRRRQIRFKIKIWEV